MTGKFDIVKAVKAASRNLPTPGTRVVPDKKRLAKRVRKLKHRNREDS
jgi:hypothetical protein